MKKSRQTSPNNDSVISSDAGADAAAAPAALNGAQTSPPRSCLIVPETCLMDSPTEGCDLESIAHASRHHVVEIAEQNCKRTSTAGAHTAGAPKMHTTSASGNAHSSDHLAADDADGADQSAFNAHETEESADIVYSSDDDATPTNNRPISPRKKPMSPHKKPTSPHKKKPTSPKKKKISPQSKALSSKHKSISPKKNTTNDKTSAAMKGHSAKKKPYKILSLKQKPLASNATSNKENSPIVVSSASSQHSEKHAENDEVTKLTVRNDVRDHVTDTCNSQAHVNDSPTSPIFEAVVNNKQTTTARNRGSVSRRMLTENADYSDDNDESSLLLLPAAVTDGKTRSGDESKIVTKQGFFASLEQSRTGDSPAIKVLHFVQPQTSKDVADAEDNSPSVLKDTSKSSDIKTTATSSKRYVPIEFLSDSESPKLLRGSSHRKRASTSSSDKHNTSVDSGGGRSSKTTTTSKLTLAKSSVNSSVKTRSKTTSLNRSRHASPPKASASSTSSRSTEQWLQRKTTPQKLGVLEFTRHAAGATPGGGGEKRLLQTKLTANAFTQKRPSSKQLAKKYNG